VFSLTLTDYVYVTVEPNQAPTITSGNSKIILESILHTGYTATATDAENDTLTFSLTGGADQYKFQINAVSGALSFTSVTDYQNPTDANLDNRYEVIVGA